MVKSVEFFFDVGSPYSYLASVELPRICARTGATLVYRPMLLGGVFKATGNRSPIEVDAKARWTRHDLAHWAERYHAPFVMNPHFPINTLTLMRGAAGMAMRGPDPFERYLRAVMDAMWVHPRNLNDPAEIAAVLEAAGFEAQDFLALVGSPEVKEMLKATTEQAIERGVFGAPTMFVDGRMFWGNDRLHLVEESLAVG